MRIDRSVTDEPGMGADAPRGRHRGDARQAWDDVMPGRLPEPRSWWGRATDEISSWLGDTGATRRRQWDETVGERPARLIDADTRIACDLVHRLALDSAVNTSDVEVSVVEQVVILDGSVSTIAIARRVEDMALAVAGVIRVMNNLVVD